MGNTNNKTEKPWWVDYDGDIEEERRKIIERVNEIEDLEKRQEKYDELLKALKYNKYYANNPHLKSESFLIYLRDLLGEREDEDIDEFIHHILNHSYMGNCFPFFRIKNILIVNVNKKFTFLNNSVKTFDADKIIEKGKIKMQREYGNKWGEDDEKIYRITFF